MESLLVSALVWKNVTQMNVTTPKSHKYNIITPYQRSAKRIRKHQLYDRIKRKKNSSIKTTTLIFAPHPDDAILCCALEIRKRVQNNEKVKVVYITNGDRKDRQNQKISYQYGQTRKKEAHEAMKQLGLKRSDLLFLNFPDGYLAYLKDDESLTSQFTGQNKTSKQAYFPEIDYTWLNLKSSISKIITTYKPKEIFIPHATKEQHWDHREVGRVITQFILAQSKLAPKVSEYTIHPKYSPMVTPKTNQFKLNLINVFKSQFHNNRHQEFLENFAKIPEVFEAWEKNRNN